MYYTRYGLLHACFMPGRGVGVCVEVLLLAKASTSFFPIMCGAIIYIYGCRYFNEVVRQDFFPSTKLLVGRLKIHTVATVL